MGVCLFRLIAKQEVDHIQKIIIELRGYIEIRIGVLLLETLVRQKDYVFKPFVIGGRHRATRYAVMISRRFYAGRALRVEQARIYERRVLTHAYTLVHRRKVFFDKLSFNELAPTVRVDAETVKPTVKEHFRKYLAFKARSVIKSLFKALIARLSALAEVTQEIAEHHIGRILYDCVVHIHKCFRLDPIVAVDKADIVTARGRNSRLSCAEQTAVLLMHDLQSGRGAAWFYTF